MSKKEINSIVSKKKLIKRALASLALATVLSGCGINIGNSKKDSSKSVIEEAEKYNSHHVYEGMEYFRLNGKSVEELEKEYHKAAEAYFKATNDDIRKAYDEKALDAFIKLSELVTKIKICSSLGLNPLVSNLPKEINEIIDVYAIRVPDERDGYKDINAGKYVCYAKVNPEYVTLDNDEGLCVINNETAKKAIINYRFAKVGMDSKKETGYVTNGWDYSLGYPEEEKATGYNNKYNLEKAKNTLTESIRKEYKVKKASQGDLDLYNKYVVSNSRKGSKSK